MEQLITREVGVRAAKAIAKHVDYTDHKVLVVATSTQFNIDHQPEDTYETIINLKRINDIQFVNKFFEAVNKKLPRGGVFVSCAETKQLRKIRILKKYPPVLNYIYYCLDFILKRVFPKLPITKKIYFLITGGRNRVISKPEYLGRLYSCGFEVVAEIRVKGLLYITAFKTGEPSYDNHPSYGPIIRLIRIGRNGMLFNVYKFRTMHPYAEYIQDYIYNKCSLGIGGKFKHDFRITTVGYIFRKFWIDETPMFINVFKGQMKLVGVRPLSLHYFNLYSSELRERRIKYKPGLIPPFYVDMPKTLAEIEASEFKYLDAYDKNPYITDIRYFFKAFYNILIKKARSR